MANGLPPLSLLSRLAALLLSREAIVQLHEKQPADGLLREAIAQDTEAGANLDNVVAGGNFRRRNDAIGDARLHQEVLAPGLMRRDSSQRESAGRPQLRDAIGRGIGARRFPHARHRARLAWASMVNGSRSPRIRR